MKKQTITGRNGMPWDCPEFTRAVRNLLKVYKKHNPDPSLWGPGLITQVSMTMTKEGVAEAEIHLRCTGE